MTGYEEEQEPLDDYIGQPQEPDASDAVWNTSSGEISSDDIVHADEIRDKAFGDDDETKVIDWPIENPKVRLGRFGTGYRLHTEGPAVGVLRQSLGWDGDKFDIELENEVKQVQEEKGLPVTGHVNEATWHAIVN